MLRANWKVGNKNVVTYPQTFRYIATFLYSNQNSKYYYYFLFESSICITNHLGQALMLRIEKSSFTRTILLI